MLTDFRWLNSERHQGPTLRLVVRSDPSLLLWGLVGWVLICFWADWFFEQDIVFSKPPKDSVRGFEKRVACGGGQIMRRGPQGGMAWGD